MMQNGPMPEIQNLSGKQIHYLKCWPEHYQDITHGHKTHEIRVNDRDYQVGDLLVLREYKPQPAGIFTGKYLVVKVTHMTTSEQMQSLFGIDSNLVVMSFEHMNGEWK